MIFYLNNCSLQSRLDCRLTIELFLWRPEKLKARAIRFRNITSKKLEYWQKDGKSAETCLERQFRVAHSWWFTWGKRSLITVIMHEAMATLLPIPSTNSIRKNSTENTCKMWIIKLGWSIEYKPAFLGWIINLKWIISRPKKLI